MLYVRTFLLVKVTLLSKVSVYSILFVDNNKVWYHLQVFRRVHKISKRDYQLCHIYLCLCQILRPSVRRPSA